MYDHDNTPLLNALEFEHVVSHLDEVEQRQIREFALTDELSGDDAFMCRWLIHKIATRVGGSTRCEECRKRKPAAAFGWTNYTSQGRVLCFVCETVSMRERRKRLSRSIGLPAERQQRQSSGKTRSERAPVKLSRLERRLLAQANDLLARRTRLVQKFISRQAWHGPASQCGTSQRYRRAHCRCNPCKEAYRAYRRDYRARLRAKSD